ncbi:YiaA/YiaB family inner membrane protein [uncultured Jatrophihabitans sp.]|uniref:YiaA/YiaB family inner membrane protein n=1 Tax=uncultured Jatrophihabitans sp. TaxID=1610747 RepID=UPI0035CB6E73
MTNSPASKTTSAFYIQSIVAFSVALGVVVIGEVYLPVSPWVRAFLALGTVFLVSATFSLAKCVRDQQESETVVSRIDRARIERMLADYDPYRAPTLPQDPAAPDAQRGEMQQPPAPSYPSYPVHSSLHA